MIDQSYQPSEQSANSSVLFSVITNANLNCSSPSSSSANTIINKNVNASYFLLYYLLKFWVYLKAPPRKYQNKRKPSIVGRSKITRSTPKKLQLEQKTGNKIEKLKKKEVACKKRGCKQLKPVGHIEDSSREDDPESILKSDTESETLLRFGTRERI